MNNDRFRTRVFDKQEKKMIYVGNDFNIDGLICVYQGMRSNDIIITISGTTYTGETSPIVNFIPLGDRFIPMQCTGHKGTGDKLIYEDDFLDYWESNYNDGSSEFTGRVIWDKRTCAFVVHKPETILILGRYGKQRFPERRVALTYTRPIFVRGNNWENPELMEKNE